MGRFRKLGGFQVCVLVVLAVMCLVFAVIYPVVIGRVGYIYNDTVFVPEQSGGGTCVVYTIVLPDGTATNISSPIVFETAKYDQGVMVGGDAVESGVVPDIPLDRQYFYDNEALLNAIKGVR